MAGEREERGADGRGLAANPSRRIDVRFRICCFLGNVARMSSVLRQAIEVEREGDVEWCSGAKTEAEEAKCRKCKIAAFTPPNPRRNGAAIQGEHRSEA